jgi:hypothetical protein
MKNALIAVAITALMGGLVIAPVTQQSAQAQVYGGLKAAGTTGGAVGENNLILVGRGGGHGGGGHGGGGHGGGRGGGHGGGHWGGGGGHHGGGHFAHGGGRGHGHGGRAYAHNWHHGGGAHHASKGHRNNYAHNYNYRRYYRYGRYRNYGWYGGAYASGYRYGNCAWLRRQALITGSPYWWHGYNACVYY